MTLVNWMDKNVNYVDEESKPLTAPQAQPLENFWEH